MHRFATQFYQGPVAVEDLGWVSFRNDEYVLDLWGLANRRAARARVAGRPGFRTELAQEHGVELAMLYTAWYPDPPDGWTAVAELALGKRKITPAEDPVTFFVPLSLDDPVFLVGADEFAAFLDWKEPERVLELARLGVATRPGVDRSRLDPVLAALRRADRVSFFEIEPLAVSSSGIRALLVAGTSIDGLVPPAVAAEIALRGLYSAR
jgi:hypothetical protein